MISDINKIYLPVSVAIFVLITLLSLIFFFDPVSEILPRDSDTNVFEEIKILKSKNDDLKNQIAELESHLEQISDQNSALTAIENEIVSYTKLSGEKSIFGKGISLQIDGQITTPWLIDSVNEFFTAGAQAVAINGIRITNASSGFDTLPKKQIFLSSSILKSPFTLEAIGDPGLLTKFLDIPGGTLQRLKVTFPTSKIDIYEKDLIQML